MYIKMQVADDIDKSDALHHRHFALQEEYEDGSEIEEIVSF